MLPLFHIHTPQGNLTKIVVMDSTGSDKARHLARALVSLGYQLSYVMEGGFKGWAAAELPFVEDAVEYDASTGAVIGDELEVIAERANEVVTTVAQPQVGRGVAACSDLAVLVISLVVQCCVVAV
jgi:3-mercaptopyruvate sulfurtransferase SseA